MYKKDSPNNFLGGITAGIAGGRGSGEGMDAFFRSSLGRAAQQVMQPQLTQAQQVADASVAAGGTMGTPDQNPMTGGAMDQANPLEGKTFTLTPANMMGNAKPLFSEQTQGMAQAAFGSGLERQMSMPNSGSVTQMKDIPEGNKGAGLRALNDSVVEQMGYDSATKMVSPLDSHHPQFFTGGREVTKKEFDSINESKKAKTYLGGGQGLIPDALTGGKPTRQFLNESKLFNPTTTKEKVADLNDTRMKNAAGGNSITGNTDNAMYKYYEKRKKETRPNRTDRY